MPSYFELAARELPSPGTTGSWAERAVKGLVRLGRFDGKRIGWIAESNPGFDELLQALDPDPTYGGSLWTQRIIGGGKKEFWLACRAAVAAVAEQGITPEYDDVPDDTPLEEVPGWEQDPGNDPQPGDLVVINALIVLGRAIEDAIAYLTAPGSTSNKQAKAIMENIADQLGYIAPLIIDADNWVGTTYDPATSKIKGDQSVNGVISALGEVVQNISDGDEIGGITWNGNYYITYNDVAIAGPFAIPATFDSARRSGLIAKGTQGIWLSAFTSAEQSSEPTVIPPPSITFVGRKTAAEATSTSLTDLTGGIASAPAEGDIVIVARTRSGSTSDVDMTVTGYAEAADLYANDSVDCNFGVHYKIMGAVPDTSVSWGSTDAIVVIYVFRGVDPATPLDVAVVPSTHVNGERPNPPAITPVTPGAMIVCCGGQAFSSAALADSSLTHFTSIGHNFSLWSDGNVGMGYFDGWVSGEYDPAAWTGGSTNGQAAACACTLALRPAS